MSTNNDSRKRKRKHYRQSRCNCSDESKSSDSDNETIERSKLQDIRFVQSSRKRVSGLTLHELARGDDGKTGSVVDEDEEDNPFLQGGMLDFKKIRKWGRDGALEQQIKQAFSKESQLRDEDAEMRKYVESELLKRINNTNDDAAEARVENEILINKEVLIETASHSGTVADDALYQLPERLKKYQSKTNEEMLSQQMLCGIPEVDLGLEAKIRNIEETETAKLRLLADALEKKRDLFRHTSFRQGLKKDLAKKYQ